jgi:hypothetical protein
MQGTWNVLGVLCDINENENDINPTYAKGVMEMLLNS